MNLNPAHIDVYKCIRPRLISGAYALDAQKKYKVHNGEVTTTYAHKQAAFIPVPCGECENCRRLQRRQWATRINWEMNSNAYDYENHCYIYDENGNHIKKYQHTYFITLTYAPKYLPVTADEINESHKLYYRKHIQPFFKSLRIGHNYSSTLPALKFKYYVCGELGDEKHRYHYHIILMLENDNDIPEWLNENGTVKTEYKEKLVPHKGKLVAVKDIYQKDVTIDSRKPLELALHNIASNKKKKKSRLQTPKESTLSFILHHYFWKYGNVSVGSADTGGSANYLTKSLAEYVTKDSFKKSHIHRQSAGLARAFFDERREAIYNGSCTTMPLYDDGTSTAKVPIPRSMRLKYGNEIARINYYRENYDIIINTYLMRFPDAILTRDGCTYINPKYRPITIKSTNRDIFPSVKSEADGIENIA